MVQTVELLLDAESDAAVRREWEALAAAGLPSQTRNTSPTNRPHVSLAVAADLSAVNEVALVDAVAALPFPVRLGALLCFRGRRNVLARLVVPTAALLQLHVRVQSAVHAAVDPSPLLLADRWTPHVTLARGLDDSQLAAAIAAVGATQELDGVAVAARRYDGERRIDWLLEQH